MDYIAAEKKRNDENFPVAGWMLPKAMRAPVKAFYHFARLADDIADDPVLSSDSKRKRLMALDEALSSGRVGSLPPLAQQAGVLARKYPPVQTCLRDLLSAFLQDAYQTRYEDEAELLNYCMRSAAPVGRAVLFLGGEKTADIEASDALCNALQLINHVQDAGKDFLSLNRVYFPAPWFKQIGSWEEELGQDRATAGVRRVLDRGLNLIERLLEDAADLPRSIRGLRLRIEIGFTLELAKALLVKLRLLDPVAKRVKLNPWEKFRCFTRSLKYIFRL